MAIRFMGAWALSRRSVGIQSIFDPAWYNTNLSTIFFLSVPGLNLTSCPLSFKEKGI